MAIERVFDADKFSHGPATEGFEQAMARQAGAGFAIGVNSGTDALRIALGAAGVARGDEVVVPAYAPYATAAAVWQIGASPIFVDVLPSSYAPEPDAVRRAVTDRTRAIIISGTRSHSTETAPVRDVAGESGVTLIEDGTDDDPVTPALAGVVRAVPLSADDVLGALGDAGVVLTNDADMADRCRLLRHHGRAGECADPVADPTAAVLSGTNSKMDEIHAAVLMSRLARHSDVAARRALLAARYDEQLAPIGPVCRPARPASGRYVISAPDRDELAGVLAACGIETQTPVPVPLHLLPGFVGAGGRPGDHPVAEAAAARALALPLYPDLDLGVVDQVSRTVSAFFAGRTA